MLDRNLVCLIPKGNESLDFIESKVAQNQAGKLPFSQESRCWPVKLPLFCSIKENQAGKGCNPVDCSDDKQQPIQLTSQHITALGTWGTTQ